MGRSALRRQKKISTFLRMGVYIFAQRLPGQSMMRVFVTYVSLVGFSLTAPFCFPQWLSHISSVFQMWPHCFHLSAYLWGSSQNSISLGHILMLALSSVWLGSLLALQHINPHMPFRACRRRLPLALRRRVGSVPTDRRRANPLEGWRLEGLKALKKNLVQLAVLIHVQASAQFCTCVLCTTYASTNLCLLCIPLRLSTCQLDKLCYRRKHQEG